ncbi:MAG: hypothetical protein IH608_03600 [Proteobacteria bacterium]|nr:hypothetical protein [Pseudomonadota bacterium]
MRGSLLTFLCPACGTREQAANENALGRLRQEGLCQGCRARRSLERRPELLPLYVGFWKRSGFPASASWLAAVGSALPKGLTASNRDVAADGRLH